MQEAEVECYVVVKTQLLRALTNLLLSHCLYNTSILHIYGSLLITLLIIHTAPAEHYSTFLFTNTAAWLKQTPPGRRLQAWNTVCHLIVPAHRMLCSHKDKQLCRRTARAWGALTTHYTGNCLGPQTSPQHSVHQARHTVQTLTARLPHISRILGGSRNWKLCGYGRVTWYPGSQNIHTNASVTASKCLGNDD